MSNDQSKGGQPLSGRISPPLKWHRQGGKSYLAKKIIELMPPRCKNPNKPDPKDPGWLHYVEAFAGGAAVALELEQEGISVVINDLNRGLANFWSVLQDEHLFEKFDRMIQAQSFSEEEWKKAKHLCDLASFQPSNDQGKILLACQFFIACRQSLSGRMKGFTGITRKRTRRGMNAEASAWLSCIEGLPEVHGVVKRWLIRNQPATELIAKEDGPRTLFYLDPPYLHSTRETTGEYHHEMTEEQHGELLEAIDAIKGRFLLSGYHSDLYDDWASSCGWTCHEFQIDNKSSSAKTKPMKTECVWTNF